MLACRYSSSKVQLADTYLILVTKIMIHMKKGLIFTTRTERNKGYCTEILNVSCINRPNSHSQKKTMYVSPIHYAFKLLCSPRLFSRTFCKWSSLGFLVQFYPLPLWRTRIGLLVPKHPQSSLPRPLRPDHDLAGVGTSKFQTISSRERRPKCKIEFVGDHT